MNLGLNLALGRPLAPSGSSGAAPIDPATLAAAYYRPAAGGLYQSFGGTGTLASADGDPIGYMPDVSAGGHVEVQSTNPAWRPLLKLAVADGKPAARFDGSTSNMGYAGAIGISGSAACSAFAVIIFRTLSATTMTAWTQGANATNACRMLSFQSGTLAWRFNGSSQTYTAAISVGTPYLISAVIPAGATVAQHPMELNGAALAVASTSNGSTVPNLTDSFFYLGMSNSSATPGNFDLIEGGLIASAVGAPTKAGIMAYYKATYPSIGLP